MKSCDIFPKKPISSVKTVYPYSWESLRNAKKVQSVYINTSAIPHFAKEILPNLISKNDEIKIVLVSGDADETVFEDIFETYEDFILFIEDSRIIHWFSQNVVFSSSAKKIHEKLTPIPIGLDYHTLSECSFHEWGIRQSPIEQENSLKNIRYLSNAPRERLFKVYCNFHFLMNSSKYGYDRKDALENIDSTIIFIEPQKQKRINAWKRQSEFVFVASPFGNGYDCHRTWEALALGCIPIVKSSGLDILLKNLPVCIVDEWKDVTETFLRDAFEKILSRFGDKPFISLSPEFFLSYWVKQIKYYCRQ
jgi:hypothetical protein